MGLNQKLDQLAPSSQGRQSPRPLSSRGARLWIVLPAFVVSVALCVLCFATGRLLMGLWLACAFLSWAFLLGAAYATEDSSCARESDEEPRQRAVIGAEYAKTISLCRPAGKSLSAHAAWNEPASRAEQG